jgi:hypothetical protein
MKKLGLKNKFVWGLVFCLLALALSSSGFVKAETITTYDTPSTTLFWFVVVIIALIAGIVVSYAFFPILGLAFGVIGIIAVAFFESTGVLITSQYVDAVTGNTIVHAMPLGWYIMAPLILCILNMVLPLVKRGR